MAEASVRDDGAQRQHVGRLRSRRLWVAVGLVGLSVLYVAATFVDVWLTSRRDFSGQAPAAIVLGAAQYDGEPSPVLRRRLDHAAELYFEGRVDLVVVTGGGLEGDRTTEAKASYDYLRRDADIPDENLRLEVQGRSTYESLAASSRFLQSEGVVEVIIVTDPYHARRSELVAEEVGLRPFVSPTDGGAPFDRLVAETGAVAVGRVIGFRRLDRIFG